MVNLTISNIVVQIFYLSPGCMVNFCNSIEIVMCDRNSQVTSLHNIYSKSAPIDILRISRTIQGTCSSGNLLIHLLKGLKGVFGCQEGVYGYQGGVFGYQGGVFGCQGGVFGCQ